MHDLYVIVVPCIMIIAGILLNRSEVREVGKQLDAKIDRLEAKLEAKIDRIGRELDAKIDSLEARFDAKINSLETKFDFKIDRLRDDIRQFDRTIGQHDARMDTLASRLDNVEPHSK